MPGRWHKCLQDTKVYYQAKSTGNEIITNPYFYSYTSDDALPSDVPVSAADVLESTIIIPIFDEGVGIEKSVLDKLFRIDKNPSTRGTVDEKGSGLGLILCKEFVEKNGGKIWVESEPGEGSVFKFTVLRAKDENPN